MSTVWWQRRWHGFYRTAIWLDQVCKGRTCNSLAIIRLLIRVTQLFVSVPAFNAIAFGLAIIRILSTSKSSDPGNSRIPAVWLVCYDWNAKSDIMYHDFYQFYINCKLGLLHPIAVKNVCKINNRKIARERFIGGFFCAINIKSCVAVDEKAKFL